MPPSLPGTRKWDRKAIDAHIDEMGGIGNAAPAERGSSLQKWRDRDKADRPRHGLDAKLENILVAMWYNTDLDTLDQLPGAGPVLMGRLVTKKLVVCEGAGKDIRYKVTEEGHAEAVRIFEKWKRR